MEWWHRALRVDDATVDVNVPKKKPIREAYADRWVRERCQIGINECDDVSSLSKLTSSSSSSWTSLQPSSSLALVNHLLLATHCRYIATVASYMSTHDRSQVAGGIAPRSFWMTRSRSCGGVTSEVAHSFRRWRKRASRPNSSPQSSHPET